jgi:hypothetical protein
MVDLLVLTIVDLDQMLLMLKIFFSLFLTKTIYINEEVNCSEPSLSVRDPCFHELLLGLAPHLSLNVKLG